MASRSLGALAFLIFAWLVTGALIGAAGDEEQQASNQASLAQGANLDSGDNGTPAPGVENRDTDASYGGYDEGPKDPFRQLIPKAGEEDDKEGQDNRGGAGADNDRDSRGSNGGRSGNGRDGGKGSRSNGGDSDEDFVQQRSLGGSASQGARGGVSDQGSANQGDSGQPGGSQDSISQDDAGQAGGSGGLFNSGGDLPAP